ncbi:MAG TPA: hypothetical protein VLR91_05650, partial [Thermodesulfobacteriota bacterium]|nr:hypothetical protein [Thermodesulfobacteriota bacterium]
MMRFPLHGWIGLATLVGSQTALILKLDPLTTHFYSFIWWPYILLVDGLIYYRRGSSLIMNRPREFFLLIPWSVVIWVTFEAFNLVLQNWYYIGIPKEIFIRWPGYFVAYGTVLPAIFETRELLDTWQVFGKSRIKQVQVTASWYAGFIILGLTMLLLPLIWPLYAFPLVCGGFVFLLEPLNHHQGRPS